MSIKCTYIAIVVILSLLIAVDGKRKGRRCKAAVYAIQKPMNGKVLACCRYKRIKIECNTGYKLVNGDQFLRCKKGKILGKIPKCALPTKAFDDCGKAGYTRGRIVGGSKSTNGLWPWMVAIYRDGRFLCGGSLITPNYILTAAHCFHASFAVLDNSKRYEVWLGRARLGEHGGKHGQKHKVKKIHIHGDYQNYNFKNDIAIIQLSSSATFNRYVSAVCLPKSDMLQPGRRMYTMGWGGTRQHSGRRRPDKNSNILNYVVLPVANDGKCRKSLPDSAYYNSTTMFCAGDGKGKRDACYGDSGGPLVYYVKERKKAKENFKWEVTGIVSWGEGCAKQGKYGYFTRVFPYMHWINNIIGSLQ